MHELSLAESMRELIEEQALKEQFKSVSVVYLEVGQLSHVEAEAMRFCFESVMQGSPAEGAELRISSSKGIGQCRSCHLESEIEQLYDPCQHCGEFGLKLIQGDQVRIVSLKVT